jgi:hypothetical protein
MWQPENGSGNAEVGKQKWEVSRGTASIAEFGFTGKTVGGFRKDGAAGFIPAEILCWISPGRQLMSFRYRVILFIDL